MSATTSRPRKKTVYCLRIRASDGQPWSDPPTYYRTRKERDRDGSFNRCLGGIRTWSFEEKVTPERYAELSEDF